MNSAILTLLLILFPNLVYARQGTVIIPNSTVEAGSIRPGSFGSMGLSPNGKMVSSEDLDHLRFIDKAGKRVVFKFGSIASASLSGDGKFIVVERQGSLSIYNSETQHFLFKLTGIQAFKPIPGTSQIVSYVPGLQVIDLKTKKVGKFLPLTGSVFKKVEVSSDGSFISIAVKKDDAIYNSFYALPSLESISEFKLRPSAYGFNFSRNHVSFHEENERFTRVYNIRTKKLVCEIDESFNFAGSRMIVFKRDRLELMDPETCKTESVVVTDDNKFMYLNGVIEVSAGKYVGYQDRTIYAVDFQKKQMTESTQVGSHNTQLGGVWISKYSKELVTVHDTNSGYTSVINWTSIEDLF
ncbi:MAG: hypothetical protein EOP06_05570 [Proteobacteria bacterium]|nr:MAG: hypothetical protein EOP06_05570 [Pseudomonadota bacterium]